MKICVIGQGYIGLPMAILFAKNGCDVVGIDINEKIISNLNNGISPIEEKRLQEYFNGVLRNGNYVAKTNLEKSDVFILTVPTPYVKENYVCDLSHVISACNSISPYLKEGNIIIIESTIAHSSMKNIISPIFDINELKKDYNIKIYDSHIEEYNFKLNDAIRNSSLILILTNHNEFCNVDYDLLKMHMDNQIIFDTVGIIDFKYVPQDISFFNYRNIYLINNDDYGS